MTFTVAKYIPKDLFGFLEGEGQRIFFHLSEFDPKGGPPPIAGEPVSVGRIEIIGLKSPRARSVERLIETRRLSGTVTRFDHHIGYGFATVNGEQYYLHRSEFADGALPLIGAAVEFYVSGPATGEKRPRACHARLLGRGTR